MLKNVQPLGSPDLGGGINSLPNFFALEPDQSPNCLDVEFGIDKSVSKRYGVTTLNTVAVVNSAATGFSPDAGASLGTLLQAFWPMNEQSGNRVDVFNSPGIALVDNNTVASTGGVLSNAAWFASANSEYLLLTSTFQVAMATSRSFSYSGFLRLATTMQSYEQRTILAKRELPPLLNKLVSYWRLEEASGARQDSIGLNVLADTNTVTVAAGIIGSGAVFTRANAECLPINDNPSLSMGDNQSFSIQAWMIPATLPGAGNAFQIAGKWNTALEYVFGISPTNTLRWQLGDGAGGTRNTIATTALALATTYHCIGWYDADTDTSGLSVNLSVTTATGVTAGAADGTDPFGIGAIPSNNADAFDGRIDEVAIWKRALTTAERSTLYRGGLGLALANYSSQAYSYYLFVDSTSTLRWQVSNTGTGGETNVSASSFGAIGTGAWYGFVAWHDSANQRIGLSLNLSVNTASHIGGVFEGSAPFVVGAVSDGAAYFLDGGVDLLGVWHKALSAQERSDIYNAGAGNTYDSGAVNAGWGMYDFGAGSALRWVVISAGTGIVASSNRAMTFVTVASTRSLAYQSFVHSKSHLIATSESRDSVLIWPGSVGTFFTTLAVNSAQAAKYATDFQGFTMLMNWSADPRGVAYADNNSFTTDPWTDTFSLPSAADDEITGSAILNKKLYIFTREKVFRVSHVGGNPDFEVQEVISSWGAIQKTIKKVLIPDLGEVIICLCWDRRVRVFDGNEARIVSDPIEQNNQLLNLSLAQIEDTYLNKSFAELDTIKQVYKLWLAISPSADTTHCVNLNLRTLAWYWSSNTPYNASVMAQSGNSEILLSVKRDGFCHWIDTTNADAGTAIREYYDSPFYYATEAPKELTKGHRADFYWAPLSSGTVYIQDKVGWGQNFVGLNDTMTFSDTANKALLEKSINIPKVFNVYQFRLSSSGSTAVPWKLLRADVEGLRTGGLGRAQ